MLNKNQKVAIVTGASKGIGKAIVDLFSQKQIITIAVARRLKLTKNTFPCDVKKENDIKKVIQHTLKYYGQIDILVNNVGIVKHDAIEKETLTDWNEVINTNLTSHFLFCKYTIPYMKKRKYGKIINISSMAGRFRSPKTSSAYVCSKYAVVGLTRQLAFQYAKDKITINCLAPGPIQTPMLMANLTQEKFNKLEKSVPIGRVGRAEEIAQLAYFLTTDKINYLTGAIIDINRGQF